MSSRRHASKAEKQASRGRSPSPHVRMLLSGVSDGSTPTRGPSPVPAPLLPTVVVPITISMADPALNRLRAEVKRLESEVRRLETTAQRLQKSANAAAANAQHAIDHEIGLRHTAERLRNYWKKQCKKLAATPEEEADPAEDEEMESEEEQAEEEAEEEAEEDEEGSSSSGDDGDDDEVEEAKLSTMVQARLHRRRRRRARGRQAGMRRSCASTCVYSTSRRAARSSGSWRTVSLS